MDTDPRWGPVATGGPGRRWPRRVLLAVAFVVVAGVTATLGSAALVVLDVENRRQQVAIGTLDVEREEGEPLNILVVGSDARDGLSEEERRALSLGSFEGQRADTNIVVSISADRSTINLVSIPRDLVVTDPGDQGIAKITELYQLGRETLVDAVQQDVGLPVNHYVEVSITGFIDTVEAVGGVEMCLDEPLRDRKSGADFEAGCQQFSPEQALAYVRSRRGVRGDFERIERQQTFMRALAARIVDGSLLLQPTRLRAVGDQLADSIVTDDGLGVELALELGQDLQRLVAGGVPMVTLPGYTQELVDDGMVKDFVVPYGPGLDALVADMVAGRELPSRGTADQRAGTRVQLWTGGRVGATAVLDATLGYGGFRTVGTAVGAFDAGGRTTVWARRGSGEQARWVAAHLGAPLRELPLDVEVDPDVDVFVAVGDDAGEPVGAAAFAAVAP